MKKIRLILGSLKFLVFLFLVLSSLIIFRVYQFYPEKLEFIAGLIFNLWLIVPVMKLFIDKEKEMEPNLSISLELIRSSLACFNFRNQGNVDLIITSFKIDNKFLNQLSERTQAGIKSMKNTSILLTNTQNWILNIGVTINEVIGKYEFKTARIDFCYKKPTSPKTYKDSIEINFENYAYFMLYISELDEINNTLGKIEKAIKSKQPERNTKLVETTQLQATIKEHQMVSNIK